MISETFRFTFFFDARCPNSQFILNRYRNTYNIFLSNSELLKQFIFNFLYVEQGLSNGKRNRIPVDQVQLLNRSHSPADQLQFLIKRNLIHIDQV